MEPHLVKLFASLLAILTVARPPASARSIVPYEVTDGSDPLLLATNERLFQGFNQNRSVQNPEKKIRYRKFLGVDLKEPEEGIILVKGQSYELTCVVNSNPPSNVYWIRGENLEEQIRELELNGYSSISMDLPQPKLARITSKYLVDCASAKDEGSIHCVAFSDGRRAIKSTRISVLENSGAVEPACSLMRAPVITEFANMVFAVIGSTVVLPCAAIGEPRPSIRWFDSNGNEIRRYAAESRYTILEDGALKIRDLERGDMGGPVCVAESQAGRDSLDVFLYPMKPL